MADEEHILAFIGNSFRSVWTIEVLRFLLAAAQSAHDEDDLIVELRVSKSVVAQSLAQLEAVALVARDEDGRVRFQPAGAELAALASEAVALYERRPDQVRRTIISRTSPGLTAFADAFRLRKD